MNYSDMSDFEINRKVLEITLGVKPLGYAHNADKRSAGMVKSNQYHWYDYCNSWADAGPIIQEKYLSIECDDMFDVPMPSSYWKAYNPKGSHYTDNNPLRAAMIVFLMMQEGK